MKDRAENQDSHGRGRAEIAAWVLFCSAFIVVLVNLLFHCISYADFEMPLDDGEGFVLNQALYLAMGQSPYLPIDAPPYVVTNYPPVFIGLLALLVKLFGPKLALGRAMSIISGLLILWLAWLAGKPARPGMRMMLASFVAPALIAAAPAVYFWMPLCRVDMFANLLSLGAVYVAWRYPTRAGLYASLPLLWLALYTRQSAVEGFAVIAIILFLQRRKELLWFVIIYIAGALIIFASLYMVFGPEFPRHIFTYTKTRWFFGRLIMTFESVFTGMLLPAAVAVFAAWRLWKERDAKIWIIYFIVGFLLAFLAGKVGSAQNYFIPMFIPQAIIIGMWFHREYMSPSVPRGVRNGLVLGMAVLVTYMGFAIGDREWSFRPTRESAENGKQLLEIIMSFDGPVFIEDEGLTLLAGREVIYTPFIMNELQKEGLWDQTPFLDSLRRAEYELIVLRFNVFDPNHDDIPGEGGWAGWDRFSPEMEEAIAANYVTDPTPLYMRRSWYFYTRRSEGPPKVRLIYEPD